MIHSLFQKGVGKIVRENSSVWCAMWCPPIDLKSLNNFIIQLCYSTVTTTYCKQEWDILHSQKLSYSTFPTAILLKDTIKKALFDLILFSSTMSRKKVWCSWYKYLFFVAQNQMLAALYSQMEKYFKAKGFLLKHCLVLAQCNWQYKREPPKTAILILY